MTAQPCGICGGDGRIANAFANTTTCPACHGSGRRSEEGGFRDVTKTKPSHHRKPVNPAEATGPARPSTVDGSRLAGEVETCATLSAGTKAKLVREIVEYEGSHGKCTQTFARKIRKQLRPVGA